MVACIRHAFRENGHYLRNPLCIAGGAAAFSASAALSGIVTPVAAGAAFGAPFPGVALFTLFSFYNKDDGCIATVAKIALAILAGFGASMLISVGCFGFTITLLDGIFFLADTLLLTASITILVLTIIS